MYLAHKGGWVGRLRRSRSYHTFALTKVVSHALQMDLCAVKCFCCERDFAHWYSCDLGQPKKNEADDLRLRESCSRRNVRRRVHSHPAGSVCRIRKGAIHIYFCAAGILSFFVLEKFLGGDILMDQSSLMGGISLMYLLLFVG